MGIGSASILQCWSDLVEVHGCKIFTVMVMVLDCPRRMRAKDAITNYLLRVQSAKSDP